MGRTWDGTGIAFDCETWREALRVAKPGAHLVAFGGTRTFHRLICAIEDAGWEVRDEISDETQVLRWVYSTGFPKSHDVSKAIDRDAGVVRTEVVGSRYRNVKPYDDAAGWNANNTTGTHEYTAPATEEAKAWHGWGTALKPAWEPIVLARKPLIGTVAQNVLRFSTGAINVEACRVSANGGSGTGSIREANPRGCPVHGLPSLREADEEVGVATQAGEVDPDLRDDVPFGDDAGTEQPPVEGWSVARGEKRLRDDKDGRAERKRPTPPTDPDATGCAGTPTRDRPTAGEVADIQRARSPRQRRQGRQPARESDRDGLVGPQQEAQGRVRGDSATQERERATARCTCEVRTGGDVPGRWPSNLVLQHSSGCAPVGYRKVKGVSGGGMNRDGQGGNNVYGEQVGHPQVETVGYADADGKETVLAWKCEPKCPVAELDRQSGGLRARGNRTPTKRDPTRTMFGVGGDPGAIDPGDSGGASRFFPTFAPDDARFRYVAKASRREREAGLGRFKLNKAGVLGYRATDPGEYETYVFDAPEGVGEYLRAARKRAGLTIKELCARVGAHGAVNHGGAVSNWEKEYNRPTAAQWRALSEALGLDGRYDREMTTVREVEKSTFDQRERPRARNAHPTVKPIDLMRWLVRLVTPPNGLVLDQFAGSGSTGCAAVLEGFRFIGCDLEAEYVAIARARIDYWRRMGDQPLGPPTFTATDPDQMALGL